MHLLDGRGKLSHLLTGGSELYDQILTPPRLLSKELGLLLAMGHKDLRRRQDLEAWKEKMRVESMVILLFQKMLRPTPPGSVSSVVAQGP